MESGKRAGSNTRLDLALVPVNVCPFSSYLPRLGDAINGKLKYFYLQSTILILNMGKSYEIQTLDSSLPFARK